MKKIYLIDGSAFIFRAFYAIRPLTNSKGLPTNALFGFSKMLINLIKDAGDDPVVMIFDAGKITFRNKMYPEYKANRSQMPDDLRKQIPYFREISIALGLPTIELKNYEADDVIGTIANLLEAKEHIHTVIVSGDKDLMQLVTDQTSVYDPMKQKHYNEKDVIEKFGVKASQIIDYLAICGDSSDNIPGLSGVGPKGAVGVLSEFETIEELIENKEKILDLKSIRSRKKIYEQLTNNLETLEISKKLVTIVKDAPVIFKDKNLNDLNTDQIYDILKEKNVDTEKLNELSNELEFSSVFKNLNLSTKKTELKKDYKLIDGKNFDEFVKLLKDQNKFSFDLETTSLNIIDAEIVGASFCFDKKTAYYIPISHTDQSVSQVDLDEFIAKTKDIFEDKKNKKIGQNLKYDISILKKYKIYTKGLYFDTLIAANLSTPEINQISLDSLSLKILNYQMLSFKEVIKEYDSFKQVPIKTALEYAAEDAHIAYLIYFELLKDLKKEDLFDTFKKVEMPLIDILSEMEINGVYLDLDQFEILEKDLSKKTKDLQAKLFKIAGSEFNPNSPKQLQEIMFVNLGIPTKGLKKTKTGISTDSSVLEKLSRSYEFPKILLEYRSLFKLLTTYVQSLPLLINSTTKRLHTKFNQHITATGRLSSSDPNLQNIPRSGDDATKIRKAFVAQSSENVIICADYSQIELRVLAFMSKDENLIKAFIDNKDIHASTAYEILGIDLEQDLSVEDRNYGKTINFGIIYGMSAFRLAKELNISFPEANNFINNYFNHYSGVKTYFEALKEDFLTKGSVNTLMGRKRYSDQVSGSSRDPKFVDRIAINFPIQGSAADIIKLAMVKVSDLIKKSFKDVSMNLQVHDELVFECPKEQAEEFILALKKAMESVVKLEVDFEGECLKVPLVVDINKGENWYQAH